MAYYITEPLAGSNDIVVSVYKNTGEYVGNIICDRYKWRMSSDDAIDEVFRNLPRLVRDKRDGCIELIDCHNVAKWVDILKRDPCSYQWISIP